VTTRGGGRTRAYTDALCAAGGAAGVFLAKAVAMGRAAATMERGLPGRSGAGETIPSRRYVYEDQIRGCDAGFCVVTLEGWTERSPATGERAEEEGWATGGTFAPEGSESGEEKTRWEDEEDGSFVLVTLGSPHAGRVEGGRVAMASFVARARRSLMDNSFPR
jgi:hypothetical protein